MFVEGMQLVLKWILQLLLVVFNVQSPASLQSSITSPRFLVSKVVVRQHQSEQLCLNQNFTSITYFVCCSLQYNIVSVSFLMQWYSTHKISNLYETSDYNSTTVKNIHLG